jgi:hypothetical protein
MGTLLEGVYIYGNIVLNSSWVEKSFRENQNTHFVLNRFFPKTVVFIGGL